jgi:hypothetical protein
MTGMAGKGWGRLFAFFIARSRDAIALQHAQRKNALAGVFLDDRLSPEIKRSAEHQNE